MESKAETNTLCYKQNQLPNALTKTNLSCANTKVSMQLQFPTGWVFDTSKLK